ncbi:thiamine pyrophosphate-dependent enzyme [Desulfuromonas acetexigens]|uniref:Thiamine pyrophosphate enzyme TPP-binding domain-containing protein n=1 Tax=Trichloromonas acetexigens TaxID=38815 RepID=A0A550JGP9_9BACT|nr:thiamine pyrophosphate-dependent enzyme [Desulfuromonas acetexigens]TRO82370.1 hypothetical protein FL622_07270 [Desulfuromonas acetexigens]
MNNRPDTIRAILDAHPDAFVVFSNGLTSREAAYFHRENRCIYLLHAMGEALAVGVGLSQACSSLEIVVIEGDGNALMGLAAWSLMPVPNLYYYVLDNGSYETTGGQKLPSLPVIPSWCKLMPVLPGKAAATPNPPLPDEIWNACQQWLRNHRYLEEPAK